jgi:hypothetical protein
LQRESFANIYEAYVHNQQDVIDFLKNRYPKVIEAFEDIINGKA